MPNLALLGGPAVRTKLFPAYNPIGAEEKAAVRKVLDSGNLSQFLGAWHPDFYGGPMVRQFESDWAKAFKVKHAISVNSNTSGLYTAIGACEIGPGDEVIVSPYTMTASAVAPVIYGAVPVFADIDEDIFCLDPKSIESKITARTKAIMIVHIFGHPADMDEIMAIAKKHNLHVIEDCAQAPMARYRGQYVGAIGHIGVFSLNYHKHIHTGEGGVIVTNDSILAEKVELIRNHGEAVVEGKGTGDLFNTHGFNFRMTEIEASIGIEQLKKLPALLEKRIQNAEYLAKRLSEFPGLIPAEVREGCQPAYYCQAFKFKREIIGIERETFVDAIKAEIPSAVLREAIPLIGCGYTKPLYLQPIYQQRISKCSFNCPRYEGNVSYEKGICPVAEKMYDQELFGHEYSRPSMTTKDLDDVVRALEKVYENIEELKNFEIKNSPEVQYA